MATEDQNEEPRSESETNKPTEFLSGLLGKITLLSITITISLSVVYTTNNYATFFSSPPVKDGFAHGNQACNSDQLMTGIEEDGSLICASSEGFSGFAPIIEIAHPDGRDCLAGMYPLGVDELGNAQQCTKDSDSTYSAGTGLTLVSNRFNVDTATVQNRVHRSCDVGSSIRVIYADGTVTCETDDNGSVANNSITSVKIRNGTIVGSDVDLNSVQRRVNRTCVFGSSIRLISPSGTVTCQGESDPKVGSLTTNTVPRWSGSQLTSGTIRDNGRFVEIGTTSPQSSLHVNGDYIQIPIINGRPPESDCDSEAEVGRIVLSRGLDRGYDHQIYLCASAEAPSGWVGITGVSIDVIG
tara:strand:- start:302 stop:1366 length:1065 start_codon:yes stop_codon:yes gene_type:complete